MPHPPAPLDLDAIDSLLAKATPGPWGAFPYFHEYVVPADHMHRSIGGSIDPVRDNADYANVIATIGGCDRQFPNRRGRSFEEADANRDLIVALRNAAPALVAELRAAREALAGKDEAYRVLMAELSTERDAHGKQTQRFIEAADETFRLRKALEGIAYAEGTGPVDGSWDEPASAEKARLTLSRAATGGIS